MAHVTLTLFHYQISELPWLIRELFDVDEEESIPTWFSSVILLVAAASLFLLYTAKRKLRDPYQHAWLGLCFGFLFMSIDEIAGFHETVNSVIDFSWAVLGLAVAFAALFAYVKFLASLPAITAVKFIAAGTIFVGGAVGVELATEPYLYNDELDTLAYNLWTAVEEAMEMGGVIFFLAALNEYSLSVFNLHLNVDIVEVRNRSD